MTQPSALYSRVVDAIFSLPTEYHVPLFARYVQEAPYARIARQAGISTDGVRELLYRGTQLLRAELAPLIEGEAA